MGQICFNFNLRQQSRRLWKNKSVKTIQNQNFLLFLTLKLSNYLFLTFSGGLVAFFVLELLSKGSKQQQQQQQQQLYNWISEIHHV